MPNKMLYFNDVIYSKLSNEENASGLVSSLLEKYYNELTPTNINEKMRILKELNVIDPRKVELKEKLIAEIEQAQGEQDSEQEALKKRLEAQAKAKRVRDEDVVRLTEELKKLVKEPTKEQLNKYIFYSRNMPDKVKDLIKQWAKSE